MREKSIEQKLVKEVSSQGGLCWKFTSPGTAGVPDRLVLLPYGKTGFIEVKAPAKNRQHNSYTDMSNCGT